MRDTIYWNGVGGFNLRPYQGTTPVLPLAYDEVMPRSSHAAFEAIWGQLTTEVAAAGGATQNVTAAAFANAQAFGTARLDLLLTGTALLNTQAFGTAVVTREPRVEGTGFANAQAYGTASVVLDRWLEPAGLVNVTLFGVAQLHRTIAGAGFANAQAFGTATVTVDRRVEASGFANTSLFGTPTIAGGAAPSTVHYPHQVRAIQAQLSMR